MTECFVGIDTSNYTTSAAICTSDGEVVANLKLPLPVKAGECGLRQSDAVFAHIKNLPDMMQSLADELKGMKPLAIGVSAKPRPQEGSYMPCFLSGVAAAESFATAADIPLLRFSHQEGHIMAAVYSAGAMHLLNTERFAAFHVSGGTTEVLLTTPHASGFDIELFAATADINAGQAIDRIGVMLGLTFPCGKELEKLALQYDGNIKVKATVKGSDCCLSGVENKCTKALSDRKDKPYIAALCLKYIEESLFKMTENILETYGDIPVVFAGGVMSNSIIRENLTKRLPCTFCEPVYSTDNACGIAVLTSILNSKKGTL